MLVHWSKEWGKMRVQTQCPSGHIVSKSSDIVSKWTHSVQVDRFAARMNHPVDLLTGWQQEWIILSTCWQVGSKKESSYQPVDRLAAKWINLLTCWKVDSKNESSCRPVDRLAARMNHPVDLLMGWQQEGIILLTCWHVRRLTARMNHPVDLLTGWQQEWIILSTCWQVGSKNE